MSGGRKRAFDREEALDNAMRMFWKKGYVGASLSDLTECMGVNKPSMYGAFGNKEQLFVSAMEHYVAQYASPHGKYLLQSEYSLRARIRNYMMSVVTEQCNPDKPGGCYISLCVGEAAGNGLPAEAVDAVNQARDFAESHLCDFFQQEQHLGSLGSHVSPLDGARFIITILHGTAAMARGGKSLSDLTPLVDHALNGLIGAKN